MIPVFSNTMNAKGVTQILQSGVRGLLVSPYNKVQEGALRMDTINKIIPELITTGKSDNELELEAFPKLKHIIQNSHASINGTVKYKHFTVYAKPSMNTNSFPFIKEDDKCVEYWNETSNSSYTHKEVMKAVGKFEGKKMGKYHSMLITLPFSSPLALLAGNMEFINN